MASSPKAVAQAATYTFAMLSDPEAALAVAGGSDGIAAGAPPTTPQPTNQPTNLATCVRGRRVFAVAIWRLAACTACVSVQLCVRVRWCRNQLTAAQPLDGPAADNPTGLSAGKGYVDVSTVDAATSRHIAAAVRAAGAAFLEAPVSGSKGPAEQGKLIFLTAGSTGCGGPNQGEGFRV